MNINLSTVITLAGREGRNTLQVPEAEVIFQQGRPVMIPSQNQRENYPDDYFMDFNSDANRPCIGKEQGFLFLTRKGYAFFREEIKKARVNSIRHTDIESLDQHAEEFFNSIERSINKHRVNLQKKLDQLNNIGI